MMKKPKNPNLSPVTHRSQLAFDKETPTRFDKTSVVLSQRRHNFSAEWELGFRDRNDGKLITDNPFSDPQASERWVRGWNARNKYSDFNYWMIEPITDSKIVLYLIAAAFVCVAFISGFYK